MLVDSHAHLLSIEDPEGAVSRASAEGVGKIISIGTGIESSLATIEFSRKYRGVYVSVGVHPHSASDFSEQVMREFDAMAEDPRVVAIGETGLDYHYMSSPREDQIRSFEAHIELAGRHGLPFVVHARDADEELLSILRSADLSSKPGVIHCFSGDYETARKYLDLGFFISFSGIATFKRAEEVRDAAAKIPIDRLLYETDSPYLAPVPRRGKPNEPCNVVYVARLLSELRGLSFEQFTESVFENVLELFPKVSGDREGLI